MYSAEPMSEETKQRLLRNRTAIIDDLYVEDVMPFMIQEGIFTLDMKEQIVRAGTRKQQAETFLDRLQTRPQAAFYVFLETLQTNYEHLYHLLWTESGEIYLAPYRSCRQKYVIIFHPVFL